ncbi:MAG: PhoH family protein, partial [Deltaproteobacteria bacterium]|nr:PhoH family protein [Deltaproteobacteria bacterium]
MIKCYVIDTNVLLHNPDALFAFEDNHVVIPFVVIEEIDSQKHRQDEIGRNARVVARKLDALRDLGSLADGIRLPSGGTIKVELNHQELDDNPIGWDVSKHDNRILSVARHLQKGKENLTYLVTKDLSLRVKADILGVRSQDFYKDKVAYPRLYEGIRILELPGHDVNNFFKTGALSIDGMETLDPMPNQFFILKNMESASQSALARYRCNCLHALANDDRGYSGVSARNKEQRFALELLSDDSVRVVTLVGRAGTGKTLLALAV